MFLRSPYGSTLRKMENYDGYPNLDFLNQHEYNLAHLLVSMAGRVESPPIYGFNGIMQALFPNQTIAVKELQDRGYLRKLTSEEFLYTFTIPELKPMLKKYGVKVPRKKADIVNAIIETIDESALVKILDDTHIVVFEPSEKGFQFIKSLYNERLTMEVEVSKNIQKKEFAKAVLLYAKYSLRQPPYNAIHNPRTTSTGSMQIVFGEDWNEILRTNKPDISFYNKICTSREVTDTQLCACLNHLFGHSDYLLSPTDQSFIDNTRHLSFKAYAQRDLDDYREHRVSYYTPLCALDARCCSACAKMDGAVIPVSAAVIGKTFPPFHEGCRCTTVVCFADEFNHSGGRSARSPITKKTYMTDSNTYAEWFASLSEEERNIVKQNQPDMERVMSAIISPDGKANAFLIEGPDVYSWVCSRCGHMQRKNRTVCMSCGKHFANNSEEA